MTVPLPRSKNTLGATIFCADCGDADAAWASLNRGIFLCTECCSIHRSLGRHVSQVRSLRKSAWPPSQLALVQTLFGHGSNNVWEHLLLDPLGLAKNRKKPSPRDPLYPNKADFIRAKYANLTFALKATRDEAPVSQADLNKQLFSCVRTSHVETTLRLLALGADPCGYVDIETGISPLHVASKEGQELQAELIILYGADPNQPDYNGLSPVEYAETAGHKELANRLVELQYEMTDRLSYYLCGRKPDHAAGQHFVVPEVSSGQVEVCKLARRRLQALTDLAFEKLMQDVYDEVDRREIDAAWLACLSEDALMINDRYVVPFLPVNPDLPSTRNQHRQKLAKFTGREFSSMIVDILAEAKRRLTKSQSYPDQESTTTLPKSSSNTSSAQEPHKSVGSGTSSSGDPCISASENKKLVDSDGPLYDSVASEDEELLAAVRNGETPESAIAGGDAAAQLISLEDYLDLKTQLAVAEDMLAEMQKQNDELQIEKRHMSASADQLVTKSPDQNTANSDHISGRVPSKSVQNSSTMPGTKFVDSFRTVDDRDTLQISSVIGKSVTTRSASLNVISQTDKTSDEDQVGKSELSAFDVTKSLHDTVAVAHKRHSADADPAAATRGKLLGSLEDDYEIVLKESSKFPDSLIEQTEKLTSEIQSLLADAQAGRQRLFSGHAANVQAVVNDMVNAVPVEYCKGDVEKTLDTMVDACITLTVYCSSTPREDKMEQLSCQVVQAAFEVAKAAKTLMVLSEKVLKINKRL